MPKKSYENKSEPMVRSAITGLLLLVIVVISGAAGYMILEGFRPIDALYMTVITIATVGFREVAELSDPGKLFTILLIIVSFGIFGYVITMVTRFIVDGVFTHYYKDSKVKKSVDKLKDHVIICGFGRNGKQAAMDVADHEKDLVIIENKPEIVQYLREATDYLYVEGDATQEETMEMANIAKARALITTLPIDADNLFVVLTARQMNPDILIISRASNDKSDSKLKRAGATNVIMPDKIGGSRMARLVVDPDVVEFLDYILMQPVRVGVKIEELSCKNLAQCFDGKSIKELDVHNKTGANIIGLKNLSKQYIINPPSDTTLASTDQLFVLGTKDEIRELRNLIDSGF